MLGLAVGAIPAQAGWEYTHWEMGPEKVVESGAGDIDLLRTPVRTNKNLLRIATGRFKSGSSTFDVDFYFTPKHKVLELVVMRPSGLRNARELYDALVALHGEPKVEKVKPIARGESHTALWHDVENNNLIRFIDIGDSYLAIEYAPLSRYLGQTSE